MQCRLTLRTPNISGQRSAKSEWSRSNSVNWQLVWLGSYAASSLSTGACWNTLRFSNTSVVFSRRTTTRRRRFDNNCGKHGAYGPMLAKLSVERMWQLSRLSYCTAAKRGTSPKLPWQGSRDSTFVPHIRWPGSIGRRGVPTESGSIRRRQTFWENAAWIPLPSTSRPVIKQSRRTWQLDRSWWLALVTGSREGSIPRQWWWEQPMCLDAIEDAIGSDASDGHMVVSAAADV